jgi:hypothetical protein
MRLELVIGLKRDRIGFLGPEIRKNYLVAEFLVAAPYARVQLVQGNGGGGCEARDERGSSDSKHGHGDGASLSIQLSQTPCHQTLILFFLKCAHRSTRPCFFRLRWKLKVKPLEPIRVLNGYFLRLAHFS